MALTWAGLQLWAAGQKVDGNDLIVLARDAEGNTFSPLEEVTIAVYHPETAHSGEIYQGDPIREENDVRCIVLWPVN